MPAGPLPLTCPACRKSLPVPASLAGATIRCTACHETMIVPQSLPHAVPVVPAPPPATLQPTADPFDFYSDAPTLEPVDDGPVFFTAIEPRTWTTNRLYRVYVTRRELVAVWAGKHGADAAVVAGVAAGGLIGGLIAGMLSGGGEKATAHRRAELADKTLDELRRDHPYNFVVRFKDVDVAKLDVPSFWFRLNHSGVPKIGLLRLSSAGWDGTLALADAEGMRRAIDLLGDALGDRLEVGVEWDAKRRRFRRA